MRKLDPQLEFLMETDTRELVTRATRNRFGLGVEADASSSAVRISPEVVVLVQHHGDPNALTKAGLKIRGIAGDIVTGSIQVSLLQSLAQLENVERVEGARAMQTDLDLAVNESRANLIHMGPQSHRGANVIVGIVDTGCDFSHPSFRRADGTSRIMFIWDQSLDPVDGEISPAGFEYGVEYSNLQINQALVSREPFTLVRHRDVPPHHGTHVTGIAAGNGLASGQGKPAGTFVGVAPEANIIIVADNANGNEGLGTSANTLDAVNYVFQRAAELSLPAVVNMSLGDNLGPHDGTSLLERGLDNLLGGTGRAFVKSAGNAGASRIHASGTIEAEATVDVGFSSPEGNETPDQFDLWYNGRDTLEVSLVDPTGQIVGPVGVGDTESFTFASGNAVRIDHRDRDSFNGDRRIFITLRSGTNALILQGNWAIRMTGMSVTAGGKFDAWIQRGSPGQTAYFLAPYEDPSETISTPGTATDVITVANYITRGPDLGSLALSSSRGPTRDGRTAPTLAAPGQVIISALGHYTTALGDPYQGMSGTSMAAPHVAGTIALLLEKNAGCTQTEIRSYLTASSRSDSGTGLVPNTEWGAGKLDAFATMNCIPDPNSV